MQSAAALGRGRHLASAGSKDDGDADAPGQHRSTEGSSQNSKISSRVGSPKAPSVKDGSSRDGPRSPAPEGDIGDEASDISPKPRKILQRRKSSIM